MAANNNLRIDAYNSINQIEKGYVENNNNIVLVFLKVNSKQSFLLKIKSDKSSNIRSDTLVKYSDENSSDPFFLKRVINDSKSYYP